MHELSRVMKVGIGYFVHESCVNSLICADEVFLVAPIAGALQILIDSFEEHAVRDDVVYNAVTKFVVIASKRFSLQCSAP